MTAYDNNVSVAPDARTDTAPGIPVARTSRDKAAVIVWRISPDTGAGADTTGNPDAGDSPLTERLARHLIAIYSDVHGTVVDFDADLNLQRAAEATGRTYSTITDLSGAAPENSRPGPAALILLRWPRPATDEPGSDANALLGRCQRHPADHGSIIVVVTATQLGTGRATYSDHEQVLLSAAWTAGLRHLHDIVPIDAADGRDAFTYATDQRSTRVTDSGLPRQDRVTTLVIFGHPRTATVTPRDSGDRKPVPGRQKQRPVPVTPDTQQALGDRHLSPGDRDEQPSHQANKPRYGATPNTPLTRSAREGEQTDGPLRRSDLGAQ
jgi:hypothetical protein